MLSSLYPIIFLCVSAFSSAIPSPSVSSISINKRDSQICISRAEANIRMYNNYAAHYDNAVWLRTQAAEILAHIPLVPGASVLDLATGTGHAAIIAKKHVGPAGVVVGLDSSSAMLKQARLSASKARVKIDWVKGDMDEPRFALNRKFGPKRGAAQFDAITCLSAFMFTEGDGLEALRNWGTLLKPDGRIIFNIQDERQDLSMYALALAAASLDIPTIWAQKWVSSIADLETLIGRTGNLVSETIFKGPAFGKDLLTEQVGLERMKSFVTSEFYECFDKKRLIDVATGIFVREFRKAKNADGVIVQDNIYFIVIAKRIR